MAKTYRVGIIGRTGKGNYGHGLDNVWSVIDRAEVIAVADEHKQGREAVAKRTGAKTAYADYRQMLENEELDIVTVGPRWIDQHHEIVRAAAEHGCHVFMEKPFCRTLEEADDVVRAFEMRHLKLAIAHQTRYTPVLPTAKKLIENDEIGEVLEVRARGKEDRRGGGEDLWVLGTHLMDLMRAFFGDPSTCSASVTAGGRAVGRSDVYEGNEGIGPLAGDALHAVYTFPDGVIGSFASQRNRAGNPSRFGLQIFGSKGIIEFFTGYLKPAYILKDSSWSPGRSGSRWQTFTSAGIDKPETIDSSGPHRGNDVIVNDLIDAIEQDRQPLDGVYDARAAMQMIVAVFDSHRQGRPVSLPLENRKNPLTMLEA